LEDGFFGECPDILLRGLKKSKHGDSISWIRGYAGLTIDRETLPSPHQSLALDLMLQALNAMKRLLVMNSG
jgi:hypothetical protein